MAPVSSAPTAPQYPSCFRNKACRVPCDQKSSANASVLTVECAVSVTGGVACAWGHTAEGVSAQEIAGKDHVVCAVDGRLEPRQRRLSGIAVMKA